MSSTVTQEEIDAFDQLLASFNKAIDELDGKVAFFERARDHLQRCEQERRRMMMMMSAAGSFSPGRKT